MRRRDLSVGERLGLGFGVAAALLVTLGGVTLVALERKASLNAAEAAAVASAEAVNRAERATLRRGIAARAYALTPDAAQLTAYREVEAGAARARAALAPPPDDPAGAALVARALAGLDGFAREAEAFVALVGEGVDRTALRERERALAAARDVALGELDALGYHLDERVHEVRGRVAAARRDLQLQVPATLLGVVALLAVTALVTIRGVRGPVGDLVAAADDLAAGDHAAAVALGGREPGRSELGRLAAAFGQMAVTLRAREARLAANARLAAGLAATLDVQRLCDEALATLVAHVQAELGAVYLVTPEGDALRRCAAFALDGRSDEALALGEGVPGQAARSNATVHVRDLPPDAPFKARFGFDALPPRALVAAPMTVREREVVGVVLLGSVRELPEGAVEFVEQAARQLAVSVENARHHARVQELAAALNERNDELQAQNEELQAQQEELQAQQEELQVQQEELQAQRDELEARQEQLLEADRRKDEFLAVLSHELRNPLMPLRLGLQVLAARPDDERAERALTTMDRQLGHLTRLVDDLLDVARISRGKVHLRREPVELCGLVREVVEDHRDLLGRQGLSIELSLPEGALSVEGDPDRLAQVVGNVLHNAIKFTPSGGRVSVTLAGTGDRAQVVVSDTGLGMAPDVLARLFQPFAQADRSLARTGGGLGLGLALARGLVELHGGAVRAASPGEGQGAEVTIELPLAGGGAPPPVEAARAEAAAGSADASLRVLVIEDNVDAASTLRDLLELEGHAVEVAHTGAEGLAAAASRPPDLVLCDLGLPDMSGHDVARSLRADPSLQGLQLVALTGYARPEDRQRAAEAGFDEHLSKPPPLEALEVLLARAGRRGGP
ncbi:MAG: ATP-binding protein [Planctomycetes bacterium]|nr:ATP-binding protein [Planctomycetota bacterium]